MVPRHLSTRRLVLRTWREDDAAELRAVLAANDGHLRPWIPFMAHEPRDVGATVAWLAEHELHFLRGSAYRYRVEEGASGALLGEVMLMDRVGGGGLEGGYWFAAEAGGRGYATEAMGRLVDVAFGELGARWVEFHCDRRNGPSIALARRLGARLAGTREVDGGVTLEVWRVEADQADRTRAVSPRAAQ